MSRVLVVITNWNRADDTVTCIRSLRRSTEKGFDLLVVDDGSSDGSAERIRLHTGEEVLALPLNQGYVHAANAGLHVALERSPQYVLLVNNDVAVAPDMLEKLLAAVEVDRRIGVAGPKILTMDRPNVIWAAGGKIHAITGWTRHRALGLPEGSVGDGVMDVEYVPGTAQLLCTDLLRQIGLFDEFYEMYYEEVAYQRRVRAAGYRIVCVGGARMWHKVSASTGGTRSPRVKYYMTRNRITFMGETCGGGWFTAFLLVNGLVHAGEFAYNLLMKNPPAAPAIVRGVLDGLSKVLSRWRGRPRSVQVRFSEARPRI